MHVNLKHPIPSVKEMASFYLPDFAVLIGRNGVGKTQLLKAIANGAVTVSGVHQSDIEEYDINSFQPNDPGSGGWGSSSFFHRVMNRYYSEKSGSPLIKVAEKIFQETLASHSLKNDPGELRKFEATVRSSIHKVPDFSTLQTIKEGGTVANYVNSIVRDVIEPLRSNNQSRSSAQANRHGGFNNDCAALVCQAMKLSSKLPHELCREDILHASHYAGSTIGNQLSHIFARYKVEQHVWAHTESENSEKSVQQLMAEYRAENRPPWEILRGRLDRMQEASRDPELFNFEFSDPEDEMLSYADCHQYSFSTKFTNKATGDSYSVAELSSGEKIILCLCLSAFNQDMGQCRPGLLLLDELDAVLHPSMISALIAGLKDQFVSSGTRVIMATHSVTTVSLLEEGETFRISRTGGKLDVQPATKSEAVDELSEGFATIEAGLKIATSESAAPITILTEGNNALHLKRWANLFFKNQVKVFGRLQHRTGKNELALYGRLLAKMETNSHFLIVWDCDAKPVADKLHAELSDSNNVTAFAFKRRTNKFASEGIENNYDEKHLQAYTTISIDRHTGKKSVTVSGSGKTGFATHVHEQGTKEYFNHFEQLKKVVEEILSKQ